MYQTIVALLAGLGAILVGIACTAVAAIHGLTILLETTAGNDRMENWPNIGLFLDWIGQLWFLINTAIAERGIGPGTGMVAAGAGAVGPPPCSSCSRSSCSAPWRPIHHWCRYRLSSSPAFRRHAIAWLAFYVQSAGLLAVAMVLVFGLGPRLDPRAAVPLAALLFSAVVMIYFRLLGRLAFYCSTEPEEEEVLE